MCKNPVKLEKKDIVFGVLNLDSDQTWGASAGGAHPLEHQEASQEEVETAAVATVAV